MGNDLAKTSATGGMLANLATLKRGIKAARAQVPETGGDQYLRMLTDGHFVFGQGNHDVSEKTRLMVNPESFRHGYTCWTNKEGDAKNENVDELMVPITQPKPGKADLPDHGWPWKDQMSVQMKIMDGPHKGQQVLYKASSVGGVSMMAELLDALFEQLETDPEAPVLVITLYSDHYSHKKYGRTYTPHFDLVDALPMPSVEGGPAEAEEDEEEEEAPKRPAKSEKRRKPEPEPEPEEDEDEDEDEHEDEEEVAETPKRRRRRS